MKSLGIFLSLLLVIALIFTAFGCAKPEPAPAPAPAPKPAPAPTPAPAPKPGGELLDYFVFGLYGSGKTYVMGAALSDLINRYSPEMKSVVQQTPGTALKAKNITEGKINCFLLSATDPYWVYTGDMGLPQTKLRNLTSGGFPGATVFTFFTRPDTGIKTIKDLKGKVVYGDYTGNPWMGIASEAMLRANGLTTADCNWLKFTSQAEAVREVKEGRADAFSLPLGTGVRELADTVGVWAIPLSEAEQAEVNKVLPAFSPFVVPKGQQGIPEDTPMVKSDMCYWVSPTLSDISAYTVVKILYEHIDEYHAAYPSNKGFALDQALNLWVIPYHPGSIAYFKEAGIWTAEHDEKQAELLKKEAELFK